MSDSLQIYRAEISQLARQIIDTLSKRGAKIGVAESLTGGLLCDALVQIPGASKVVKGGIIAYTNEVKRNLLHVDSELLLTNGAVDPDVAFQMACGAKKCLHADYTIATTGFAGPAGVLKEPEGIVYICILTPDKSTVQEFRFADNYRRQLESVQDRRNFIRLLSVKHAFEMLTRFLSVTN